jgi:hypothetical protein
MNIAIEYIEKLRMFGRKIIFKHNSYKEYKHIAIGLKMKKLSKEQKKAIQEYYYSKCGKKINTRWHQYFYTTTGIFDVRYLPPEFYSFKILQKLNNPHFMCRAYADKNFAAILFPDVLQPKTIIKNINGLYYDCQGCPITEAEAIHSCLNLPDAIIKPSINSSVGKNIIRFSSLGGIINKDTSIEHFLSRYHKNFIIQEFLSQHPTLSLLNPALLNTMRIMTYRREEDVVFLCAVMRVGKKNATVDNMSKGGVGCRIHSDGRLDKYGYSRIPYAVYEENDWGIKFSDIVVPSFPSIVKKAKSLHFRVPYARIIGWDFAVNHEGEAVLIEINTLFPSSLQQFIAGFGEYTDEIIEAASNC